MKSLFSTLTTTLLIIACLTNCSTESHSTGLAATKWKLKGYVTAQNPEVTKAHATETTIDEAFMLEFMDNLQTYGWGEKNSIGGRYKISGSSICFQELIQTQRSTQFQDESVFFALIENATEYTVNNQELYLYSDQKKNYLIFEKLQF